MTQHKPSDSYVDYINLSGVDSLIINIVANCPSCGTCMRVYYGVFGSSLDTRRVNCTKDGCPENGTLWDLDIRTGMATRVVVTR